MLLPETFSFACALKTNCGRHALAHLPVELAAFNANAPLILANRDQIGKKRVATVIDAFRTSGLTLGVYDRLADRPQPDLLPVLARLYRDGGCDSLLAVGSGAVVDMAKCLNVIISTNSYEWMNGRNKDFSDPGPLAPLMLVAWTGGNGDEATAIADTGLRRVHSPWLVPGVACIDPAMMGNGEDHDVVDGALIALSHAVESFLDPSTGPMCRAYAHTAIRLIIKYLPMALRQIDRKNSLCAVVNGQVAAGCAYSAATPGICHRLAIRLSQSTNLPLGFLLALLLPHLVEQVGTAQPGNVGELLYPMAGEDIYAVTAADLVTPRTMALFWEFFDALGVELGEKIPSSLAEAGLTEEQVQGILSQLAVDPVDDRVTRIIDGAREGGPLLAS